MKDLTVIMLTPNKVPKQWVEFHKEKLLEVIGDTPIITVSNEPLDWGTNLIQTEYSLSNIFFQILRAAKLATTDYIAIAEDDTLYPKEHFEYRPPMDIWAYNMNRWKIFTWGEAFYFLKAKPANGCLIGPRELTVAALEARFTAYPEGLPWIFSKELGVHNVSIRYDQKRYQSFRTVDPVVSFDHAFSIDELAQQGRKWAGPIRFTDTPLWGPAKELREHFV